MQRLCRLILMLVVLLLIGAYIQKPEYIIYSIISGSGGDTRDLSLLYCFQAPASMFHKTHIPHIIYSSAQQTSRQDAARSAARTSA